MLGYVRPAIGDLLVKHNALYQATYCGLCHSIDKNVGKVLLPFLSYDFVFLSLIRIAALGEKIETEKQFCFLHPFKNRKKRVADNAALCYAAQCALFLTTEKMLDDLADRDCSFARRLLLSLWTPWMKRACRRVLKKNPSLSPLSRQICESMEKGRALEKKGATLDAMCTSFAECLSAIFSFGTDGDVNRILSSVGNYLGRFLYTLDALDDLEKDEKKGAFNPLLVQYGSAKKAEEHFEEVDLVLSYYIAQMKLALDLLDADEQILAICDNVVCRGLSRAAGDIMKPKTENVE